MALFLEDISWFWHIQNSGVFSMATQASPFHLHPVTFQGFLTGTLIMSQFAWPNQISKKMEKEPMMLVLHLSYTQSQYQVGEPDKFSLDEACLP